MKLTRRTRKELLKAVYDLGRTNPKITDKQIVEAMGSYKKCDVKKIIEELKVNDSENVGDR